MTIIFSSAAMYLAIAVLSLFVIYYLYLAFRLDSYGEKQWLHLLLVALPTGFIFAVLLINKMASYTSDSAFDIFVWLYVALIIVSLVSGFAVYWVMGKYRYAPIFTHFYAFFYFFNAFVLIGLFFSVFSSAMNAIISFGSTQDTTAVDFFFVCMKLSAFYGIAVLISGVGIMVSRLRHLKAENKAEKKE